MVPPRPRRWASEPDNNLTTVNRMHVPVMPQASCCDHLRNGRPALYERSQALKRPGKIVSSGGKAQTEMRRHIKAISGSQEDSTLGGGLAERVGVLSAQQPGKRGHAALGRDPAEHVAMVRHEAIEELEVSGGGFLGFAEHDLTLADCDFGKNFSGAGIAD